MEHWSYHEHLKKLAKKIVSFRLGAERVDVLPILNASVSLDETCAKKMLSILPDEITKMIEVLNKSGKNKLSNKLMVLYCYIEQLQNLLGLNLRDLVGLTRDDIATLQRVSSLHPIASGKRREALLTTLTDLVLDCAESENLENEVQQLTLGRPLHVKKKK